jgi:hypothetical protein
VYLGPGDAGELRELLCGVVDTGTLVSREAVRVISFEEFYGAAEPVDPAAVIKRYDAATQEALADGYRGLRVSADVTDLVRAPERQDAFAAANSCWSGTPRAIRCRRCAGIASNSAMR